MVDPSFSMVTVQSEDSGIVWETASSRCSTPWASETSSISEAYSMEGSGAAGKITIVFDEEKIVRRRTRSGGRSSRLSDRLSRPGSSRSASALGVERPEMAEVSLPNVKQEKAATEPDLEELKNKDQQLFSLISEGYEILNIRVPSKLPTVDEEESTELQDNLSYLDQTPKIRSRNHHNWAQQENQVLSEEGEIPDHDEPVKQDTSQPSADTEPKHVFVQKESTTDIDYFEKFTLLDEVAPGEQAAELQEEAEQPGAKPQAEEQKPAKETPKDTPSASEDSFVFVTDVEIVGAHLDEVFYGEGPPADALQGRDDGEGEAGARMRSRRESQKSMKESGSVLFGSEETVLTPIYISPGPPKIIDPILLEEPTAMSFMYSDLYEDAVGERRRSDEEYSEAESVTSEKSYKRCLLDSEEPDGYLEKFILKDETPTEEVQPEAADDKKEGRMMWSQNKFEMTGCLTRSIKEEDQDTKKTDEPKAQKDSIVAMTEKKKDTVTETQQEREGNKFSIPAEEQAVKETSSVRGSRLREDQEVKPEVKKDEMDPPESCTDEPLPEIQVEETKEIEEPQRKEERTIETEQQCQTQKVVGSSGEVLVKATDETSVKTPAQSEVPALVVKPEMQTEKNLSQEAVTDSEMLAADEDKAETPAEESVISTEASDTIELSAETSQCKEEEAAADIVAEDSAPVEVITDCDSAVHAVVEVTEKAVSDKEIQTQVHIDLQEISAETTDAQAAAPEGETEDGHLEVETVRRLPEIITKTDQESEVKKEISSELPEPVIPEQEDKTDSDKKRHKLLESEQHLQEESVADSEPDKKLVTETKTPTEDTGAVVQDVNSDELILLVPKGQAVEINIDQWLSKTTSDVVTLPEQDSTHEHLLAPEDTTALSEAPQAPVEETKTEPEVEEVEPEVALKEEELPRNYLDRKYSSLAPVEEAGTERVLEEDEGVFSPLRSFTPQEDLSGLHREDIHLEEANVEQKAENHRMEDAPETDFIKEPVGPDVDLYREDEGRKKEHNEVAVEAPELPIEELEYEVISKQDVNEMAGSGKHRDAEEPRPEAGQEREEPEMEDKMFDLSREDELIEADYEIIDAEEESQCRLAAELQGMDWFCVTCECLLSEDDYVCGEHHSHVVDAVDNAYEKIKEKLSDWIAELQGRSENIEDLVSELELAYNSVEEQCVDREAAMQAQNEEMMALVMEQYNNMSISMEEEKKTKLEQLYDQIVSFQESIDSVKATLETTAREAETDARSPEDIHSRLKASLNSATSLELGPKGLLVFEDYAKGNTSSAHLAQRKGIPVPQRPTLQPQGPGSATSTSVTVYWKVNPGDIIDCFQVYCMEDPQGAVSEEYRVTVKESYCGLEELEPDRIYKVWVMAVNYTGCSLPSERLSFRTAPSVPVIDTERCTVTWDMATLRWNSSKQAPGQSYTLEYCRQYEVEGEGLRSISGIKSCEQKVLLQPNENYLFYIKAVNEAGASEQSEAALISTKGTRFHLLKTSAHPALELSVDKTTLHYSQDTHENTPFTSKQCPSILGELLPARGHHYWETIVSRSTAYRLGVAYAAAYRNSSLGEDNLSWCLQCVPTPTGCRYQLLHSDIQSSVFVIEMPERVGTLLDYQLGHLSFYNAQSGQLLGSFNQRFTQPCHPALALELPGSLEVSMLPEVPEFTKDS
ncbi:cardiomyopathy-associated protein 5 isoform X2 [Mastacembelus armatus]|nr:cardiomyopathy-associated protein 5-like isoform X2 [Mastacembelus armatus]